MGFDPTILTNEQRIALFDEFPHDKVRIVELAEHNTDELADYVAELSRTVPPNETRKRFEIYNWTPMPMEHYREWAMRALIQRIVCMEVHDRARVRNRPVPGVPNPANARDLSKKPDIQKRVTPAVDIPAKPKRPGKGAVSPTKPDAGATVTKPQKPGVSGKKAPEKPSEK